MTNKTLVYYHVRSYSTNFDQEKHFTVSVSYSSKTLTLRHFKGIEGLTFADICEVGAAVTGREAMFVTEARRSVRLVHSRPLGPAMIVLSLATLGLLGAASVDGRGQEDAHDSSNKQPAETASVKIHDVSR